jgi:hypothetical protein
MKYVTAFFIGHSGSAKQCHAIFHKHTAKNNLEGTGVFLATNEHDISYSVPDKNVEALTSELKAAGFKVDVDDLDEED